MPQLTLTLIQTRLHWEDADANLAMLEQKIASISERTEIVILPEMFSTGFSMRPEALAEDMNGRTVQWMKRISAERNIILAGSVIIRDEAASGGRGLPYFNRLIWMLPNGEYGVYDKRHCFTLAGEDQHYNHGNKRLVASVKGWRILLQVCYDLRFPVWARQSQFNPPNGDAAADRPEYDLLINVANWPERRVHAWRTLLQARAIENQCYVAGVNRVGEDGNGIYHSGDSLVAGPLGEVLYHKAHDEDVHTITLSREHLEETRSKIPFWKDADPFMIL